MLPRLKLQSVLPLAVPGRDEARVLRWGVLGRDRSRPHFGRKFYHFLMGMICFSLYAFLLNREEALIALVAIGGSFVVADLLRLRFSKVNTVALRLFGKLMRREELKSVSGNSFFVLGLITAVLFFPKPIVLLSVLYLAIGDPIAAVIGSVFGKHRILGKKSLEGSAANFSATALATFLFSFYYMGYVGLPLFCMALIGGLVSAVSELIPVPVDDNFSIPVLSAVLLSIVFPLFPIL